jgi:hypothetical protein
MSLRYSWIPAVLVAASALAGTVLPPAPGLALASAARGPVAVESIHFYSGKHFRHNPCTPNGSPATVFPVTVRRIYTYVHYSRWDGRHADQFRWYAPDGKLYAHDKAVTYVGQGPTSDCTWLAVRGFPAARLLGRWTFKLVVDGRFARQAHFSLVSG